MPGEDTSLVTLTTHTIEALVAIPKYGDIEAHRDLPDAFHAVTECVQLVENIVKAALQGPIKKGNPNQRPESYKTMKKSLNDCKDKAAGLKGLFDAFIQAPRNDYYESELINSKAKSLMKRMLENVQQLATATNLTTLEETKKLPTAIKEMSKLEPALVPVHIGNYSNGTQHINTGSGTQNGNYGPGQQFNAQTQNFGPLHFG